MKIFVTGTRGIPGIPGGVEKHCQELYPRIAAKGHTVIISRRSPYIGKGMGIKNYRGVDLFDLYAPKNKSLEAISHTFLSLIKAKFKHPDVVHIHAVGPSLLAPIARLLRFKVVITNHGPDYERAKWGSIAKMMLRFGELLGCRFAHKTIAISGVIYKIVRKKCSSPPVIIPNGIKIQKRQPDVNLLNKIDVMPHNYILSVSRLVPEKGLHDLIEAFSKLKKNVKLVIVGDSDHESEYSRKIKAKASQNDSIVMTGYITGDLLEAIFAYAKLFVLPSYHEGHPIALLEAIGHNLPVLVSDIPAHKEIELLSESYFECGNVESLTKKLESFLEDNSIRKKGILTRQLLESKYNWEKIAAQTIEVYHQVVQMPK
jgi:glycosyltransferase involved in cell wall biosynthesis